MLLCVEKMPLIQNPTWAALFVEVRYILCIFAHSCVWTAACIRRIMSRRLCGSMLAPWYVVKAIDLDE